MSFGAYDASEPPKGMGERLVRYLPASRNVLQEGDFRDWADIEGWAREIAAELTSAKS